MILSLWTAWALAAPQDDSRYERLLSGSESSAEQTAAPRKKKKKKAPEVKEAAPQKKLSSPASFIGPRLSEAAPAELEGGTEELKLEDSPPPPTALNLEGLLQEPEGSSVAAAPPAEQGMTLEDLPDDENHQALTGLGLLLIGCLGLGAFALKKKVFTATEGTGKHTTLRVISRYTLSPGAQLLLVEVEDSEGEPRRLLLGTGNGPPTLVAELGERARLPATPVVAAPAPAAEQEAPRIPIRRATAAYGDQLPATTRRADTQAGSEDARTAVGTVVSENDMEKARSLVEEVLSERMQSQRNWRVRGMV